MHHRTTLLIALSLSSIKGVACDVRAGDMDAAELPISSTEHVGESMDLGSEPEPLSPWRSCLFDVLDECPDDVYETVNSRDCCAAQLSDNFCGRVETLKDFCTQYCHLQLCGEDNATSQAQDDVCHQNCETNDPRLHRDYRPDDPYRVLP